jgi:Methyltransferase domain
MSALDEYIVQGGHRQVEGWIEEGALSLLMLLNRHQMGCDIQGSVAEIGVHHGRCFIALSAMRRDDEFGVAADIFENQDLNPDGSGRGDYARFSSNLETFGVSDRQAILTQDSLTLHGKDIIAAAHGQQVRLFSVDGSHTAKHTANDLKVAEEALAPHGVIVLDDWFNPDWPGVQEGFFASVRRRGCLLAPFAYGDNKLYLTRREYHDEYFDVVGQTARPLAEHHKEVVLAGFPCHHIRLPPPDIVETSVESVPPTELNVATPSPSAGSLGTGWSDAEEWGRWTVGPKAQFTLIVPPGIGGNVELAADIATFFFGERQRQTVTITIDGRRVGEWVIANTVLEQKTMSFSLPLAFVEPALKFELSFLTTRSPESLNHSEDDRELGVRISKLFLRRY